MKLIQPTNFRPIIIFVIVMLLTTGCKKDWLDAKPDKTLVVPGKIEDYQALMDNTDAPGMMRNLPSLTLAGDGDYLITDATYNSISLQEEKAAYIWASTEDFYGGQPSNDWIQAYSRILQCNVVLDGLGKIQTNNSNRDIYNNVLGSALFCRSFDFYNLAQIYCKAYDSNTATTDLGLPLRLSSNVNINVKRASVKDTYDQVINDLKKAALLLPIKPLYLTRPSRPAVYALLARLYLSQDNYSEALNYADSCLQIKKDLMNLNQLTPRLYFPFQQFNPEVIYSASLASYESFSPLNASIVDPHLYASYEANDLRLNFYFFRNGLGNIGFQGSYFGIAVSFFGGLATDELYLIKAECFARKRELTSAMANLNFLLTTRFKTNTYTEITANSVDEALRIILNERRKELCFRNLRWSDLRRLNKDLRFQVTLTRNVNGKAYKLEPNSPRYVLPIDPLEISTGGLIQNPR